MAGMAMVVKGAILVLCAAALLGGVPALGAAQPSASAPRCLDALRCLDLLEDGIDLIESGRWEAASVLLQAVVAGLEGNSSHVRDLALAYVYLGVARLQIADANETRQLFAEARALDPGLEPDPTGFSREALEIWDESREAGTTVVGVADDVSAGIRIRAEAVAAGVPADVLTTAERFSADTAKKMGRSMWRTVVGVLAVTAGAMVIGARHCTFWGAARKTYWEGTAVDIPGGAVTVGGLSAWNKPGGGCRMRYHWSMSNASGYDTMLGRVEDHEMLQSGDRDTLSIDWQASGSHPGIDASWLEERLPDALERSVGEVRPSRLPVEHLIGGFALAGLGAIILAKWSDTVVVEDVAFSVTPGRGVLASRSFGW